MQREPLLLGLDLGGTKTSVCLARATGERLGAIRMPTNADASPHAWRQRLRALVATLLAQHQRSAADIHAVGLVTPGPMSATRGLVLNPPNMPAWRNVPVKSWIEEDVRRPVYMNNDANAAGLAEYRFGEFRGTPDLVYLTMSTGIGAGVISGGHLVQGSADLGGEVGHMVVDPNGPQCPCGRRGCLEMYCGGRNVIQQVRARLSHEPASLIWSEMGGCAEDLTVSAIARAAQRGDALAREFWDRFLEKLAHGVGTIVMCFNPKAIIMGTIAIHLGDLLIQPLRERLPRYAWPESLQGLAIRPSALGGEIGDQAAIAVALEGMNSNRAATQEN